MSVALAGTVAAAVPAPQDRCAVTDPRLGELSGLAVDDAGGLWAMADGGRQVQVQRIDPGSCAVLETRTADLDPRDPEDLARGPDGILWVGDIGDNELRRDTVAVVELPASGPARLHRLTYPDGPHDAEALLADPAGRPVVVIKDAARPAGVYRTAAPPDGSGPTPLVRVGEVALPVSDTAGGPLGGLGTRVVTGAATSHDGRVVALRTYTDAWLYAAPDGDPVAALAGRPLRVPLPDEPQGEAIAFTAAGDLVSGSETRGGRLGEIRVVPGAVGLAMAAATAGGGAADPAPSAPSAAAPEWLPAAIGAGVLGGVLLLVVVAMAVRARRR